jgi:hypothetical protein
MRVRALTGPIILAALLATTPQLAFGQDEGERSGSPTPALTFNARPGTEIQGEQLGEFLGKNLSVAFGKDMRPLSVTMRLEMISSREEGVIGKWQSEAVEVEPGQTYSGATWLRADTRASGGGDICIFMPQACFEGAKITFGRFVVINHEEQYMPRECEGATHALRITLASDDERFEESSPKLVCLTAEG